MSPFDFESFINNLIINNEGSKYAILKIFINPENNELRNVYENHVEYHNTKVINSYHPNSGFDLFIPENASFNEQFTTKYIDLEVHCEMVDVYNESTGFYLYPRSSISKTPLMLANHTGVIDSGYRGRMIGAFRCLDIVNSPYIVEEGTRLLQICHPSLCPVLVKIVYNINELSQSERGDGAFGSTGR